MDKPGYVYLLASARNGTLYIGVTSGIQKRIEQHRTGSFGGFTSEYKVTILVWYDVYADMPTAIRREKAMKAWKRDWKLELIEAANADWRDLWPTLFGGPAGEPTRRAG